MKFGILVLSLILSGCTILSKDKFYEVDSSESMDHDKFNGVVCHYQRDLRVCSHNLHTRSLLIGLIVPIFPQPKSSPLSYDVKKREFIVVENLDSMSLELSFVRERQVCGYLTKQSDCKLALNVVVPSTEKVVINLDNDDLIVWKVKNNTGEFELTIRPKYRYKVHAVSV